MLTCQPSALPRGTRVYCYYHPFLVQTKYKCEARKGNATKIVSHVCLFIDWQIYKQRQHPSALASFQEIVESSKGKQIAVFLDYDGTLSPIVDDPDRAFMSDSVSLGPRDPTSCLVPLFFFYSVLKMKMDNISDESCSEGCSKVFSHCYCEWEMQRQGIVLLDIVNIINYQVFKPVPLRLHSVLICFSRHIFSNLVDNLLISRQHQTLFTEDFFF